MLETGLAAAFGFCAALFLVLLLAPAVARRVSELTWRQATRVLPQSSEEIAAARDHLRGQNAIEMRQLEMKMEAVAEKERQLRVGKHGYEIQISELKNDAKQLTETISTLTSQSAKISGDLNAAIETNAMLSTENADRDIRLAAISTEFSQLRSDNTRLSAAFALMDEAHKQVSQRLETTRNEASVLRSKLSTAESEARIARTEAKRHENDVKLANRKIIALEGKLERSIRLMAEAEEKLERKEAELKRNKEMARPSGLTATAQALAPKASTQRPQTLQALHPNTMQKSEIIVGQIKLLRPELRLAARANSDEQHRLQNEMMDLAGRITAEAAIDSPGLKAKIAQLHHDGTALSDAILRYTKTAAE